MSDVCYLLSFSCVAVLVVDKRCIFCYSVMYVAVFSMNFVELRCEWKDLFSSILYYTASALVTWPYYSIGAAATRWFSTCIRIWQPWMQEMGHVCT